MTIGQRLQNFRADTGLKQTEFAESLDIASSAYRMYELEHRKLPVPVILKLHEVYKLDIGWLLTGESGAIGNFDFDDMKSIIEAALTFLH